MYGDDASDKFSNPELKFPEGETFYAGLSDWVEDTGQEIAMQWGGWGKAIWWREPRQDAIEGRMVGTGNNKWDAGLRLPPTSSEKRNGGGSEEKLGHFYMSKWCNGTK